MSLNHSYTELRVAAVHTCNPSPWKAELWRVKFRVTPATQLSPPVQHKTLSLNSGVHTQTFEWEGRQTDIGWNDKTYNYMTKFIGLGRRLSGWGHLPLSEFSPLGPHSRREQQHTVLRFPHAHPWTQDKCKLLKQYILQKCNTNTCKFHEKQ